METYKWQSEVSTLSSLLPHPKETTSTAPYIPQPNKMWPCIPGGHVLWILLCCVVNHISRSASQNPPPTMKLTEPVELSPGTFVTGESRAPLYERFMGIPYAKPPLGQLRFRVRNSPKTGIASAHNLHSRTFYKLLPPPTGPRTLPSMEWYSHGCCATLALLAV